MAGKRAELGTCRKTYPHKWNAATSVVQGFSPDIRKINIYLNKMRTEIYKHVERIKANDLLLTSESLRDAYLGKDQKHKMLLEIFQEHNNQVESWVARIL
ncbi:hypothetical protein [Flagellimonas sp.]|uniref:hypothetical protein n=1 Tax=Flagellimonas sp. TaxID=2058762 RepID=UPI003B51447D